MDGEGLLAPREHRLLRFWIAPMLHHGQSDLTIRLQFAALGVDFVHRKLSFAELTAQTPIHHLLTLPPPPITHLLLLTPSKYFFQLKHVLIWARSDDGVVLSEMVSGCAVGLAAY